jgi:hypothetical protein
MKNHALFSSLVGTALFAAGCTAEPAPEPQRATSSRIEQGTDTGVCGTDDLKVLASPPQNLCLKGTPSAVSGSGPYDWSCGTTACSALSTRIYVEDPARDQRGALLRTIYGEIFGYGISDYVYFYWVDRYAPPTVGCRATVQAFVLASPMRAAAEKAKLQTDPALRDYIHMLYRALLPNYPGDNTSIIAGWRQSGFVTMDQLDAIFLDDAIMKSRCAAAGMEF